MRPTDTVVRAFELARSSRTIDEIRSGLRREGYSNVDAHLAGAKDNQNRFEEMLRRLTQR